MLFNSLQFMIFFPIAVVVYFMIPYKYRWLWLLTTSYYFYMNWNPTYALLILTSTCITYWSGIFLDRAQNITDKRTREKVKRRYLTISFASNLSILFFFKYYNFFNENIMYILDKLNIAFDVPELNVLLPVGISFYTFQALSYTMDVYRKDIEAEKHFGKYALFVSFFPQLVAGPIEKSKNLLPQFNENHNFDYERAKDGLILMLWGFLKKVVIADRLAILVNTVYHAPQNYKGVHLIVATVFFTFQIYCDFSSYSDIAIGAAKVMGYDLMENFRRPYLSKSIAEFWRRWHISLGGWFKDYLYIPLGGNRVSEKRFFINIMIVFLTSGLWHGASWNFVIWGFLHASYQIIGFKMMGIRDFFVDKLNINRNTFGHKLYKTIWVFVLCSFAWIFFRANNFNDAIYIARNIFDININNIFDGSIYKLGLNYSDFNIAVLSIGMLSAIDILQESHDIINKLKSENIIFRWIVYYSLIFLILILAKYESSEFIYFQF